MPNSAIQMYRTTQIYTDVAVCTDILAMTSERHVCPETIPNSYSVGLAMGPRVLLAVPRERVCAPQFVY